MHNLLSFPNEVLCQIFLSTNIDIFDLQHLMLTCSRFLNLIRDSNELWREKFKTRWPLVYTQIQESCEVTWLERVALRLKVAKEVEKTLKEVSAMCHPVGQPPITAMKKLISGEHPIPEFIEDSLVELIFNHEVNEMMTSKYYAKKFLRYIRSDRIERQLQELMKLPEPQKSLLEGAVLISQWGQMEQQNLPSLSEVGNFLDNISGRVMELVGENKIIFDAEDPKVIRKILNCINQVLYGEMGFHGNIEDYYAHENSYIDKVFQTRKGIPITLCIIYHEVARRLGIKCDPVSFPQHFLLKWQEYPERGTADSFTYIDAFNGGSSYQPRSCPALIGQQRPMSREAYSTVSAEHVFQRMVNNLIQSSRVHGDSRRDDQRLRNQLHFSRLACAISPNQTPSVVAYAELCVFLGTQLEEAIQLLQSPDFHDEMVFEPGHWARVRQITHTKCAGKLRALQDLTEKKIVCRRLPSIKYAVGLVMVHCFSSLGGMMRSRYTGVIISWDAKCQASEEWISRMGIHSLSRGLDQPFYHILTDDGNSRYVAEDSLELFPADRQVVINHVDIGLHFDRFDGRRYVPNAETMAIYPEDEAVALALLGTFP